MSAAAFQVASLVNTPLFPNSIVWSDDNLIAVATGDIVTILNPDHPHAPRGVITITAGKPFPVGVINRADLLSGCLLSTCLSRDRQPCVRSLSWSPVGFATNNGCLLAVCSAEGRVKIHRQPYCEYQAEWIELMDISDILFGHLAKISYREHEAPSLGVSDDSATQVGRETIAAAATKKDFPSRKESKRKRSEDIDMRESSVAGKLDGTDADSISIVNATHAMTETIVFPSSSMEEGSSVEVFKVEGGQHMWLPGKLQCIEGSKALVHFSETEASTDQQWFEMESRITMNSQTNDPGIATANGGCKPRIRPCLNMSNLPEQILSAKHNGFCEILKAGQQVEAWTSDGWIEGVLVGFSDDNLLVKFSGDAAAEALKPSDVRLAPLWVVEEKSWRVTLLKVHIQELPQVVHQDGKEKENNSPQLGSATKARTYRSKRMPINPSQDLITAHQYASRYSMLSSIVVAWSPALKFSTRSMNNPCDSYALLAVGAKSGDISIWRIHRPPQYSIVHQDDSTIMILVSVLKAHNAWVTALSWGLLASTSDPSPHVLLASGCSDGSVKIWIAHGHDLENSSEANGIPFSLFSEVTAGGNVLVSALSLLVPVQSPNKVLLAVGKGSGSFEVWICSAKTKSSKKVGSYDGHVQVVTGLAWAFDGRCLYSCSLDNSMRGWIHHKGSLSEVSIPTNNLGESCTDLPSVSDSCYGLAISPGNLALAVVRRFDAVLLDEMYQKRTKRATVEFFWIGGQQSDISSTANSDIDIEACPGFSKDELNCWGSKLLWSLSQFECQDKHLVIWDIIAASLAFKKCAPKFIEHIFLRWLELLFEGRHLGSSIKDFSSDVCPHLSNISSRRLHLLNIFIKRIMLSSGLKENKAFVKPANFGESTCTDDKKHWMYLMLNSEKELRERLVGICLSTISSHMSHPGPTEEINSWRPTGIAQMLKWVTQNHVCVQHQLTSLASEVGKLTARLHTSDVYKEEEQCSFCSAAVPFESPETAFCQGVKCSDREDPQTHKLARCSASMQVCPLTPLWFCICCQRRASKLPPDLLFTIPKYPSDFMAVIKPMVNTLLPKPLCPFCGISLQKLQPDFLLSISPV